MFTKSTAVANSLILISIPNKSKAVDSMSTAFDIYYESDSICFERSASDAAMFSS